MESFTDLSKDRNILKAIGVLEQELSDKTGTKVALVAYSRNHYAAISEDKSALSKITDLEKDLSAKTGDDVVIVAYSVP
jgi:hypothetical protein